MNRRAFIEILALVVLLFITTKFVWGLEKDVDIGLYDETFYLSWGLEIPKQGFPAAQWAPLYSLFYLALSLFSSNRVNLYYLAQKLMLVFPAIAAYFLLRKNRLSALSALVIAWFILVSRGNSYATPRVSHFATGVGLLLFLLIFPEKPLSYNGIILSITSLIVSYIRPEYFLGYILFSLVWIVAIFQEWKTSGKIQHIRWLAAYAVISILLMGLLKIPMGTRSVGAFGQHFAVNFANRNKTNLSPWLNWDTILNENFGPVDSVFDAFRSNRGLFLWHVKENILKSGNSFFSVAMPIFLYSDLFSRMMLIVFLFSLLVLYFPELRQKLYSSRGTYVLLFLFPIPSVISMFLIYPRNHYMLIIYVFWFVLLGILLSEKINSAMPDGTKSILLLGLLLITFTPYPRVDKPQFLLNLIRYVQSMQIEERVNVLEADGGYSVYLGDNFNWVRPEKQTGFRDFVREKAINMIILSAPLKDDVRFANDDEWLRFLANPEELGFVRIEVPNSNNRVLFIKKELIH